MTQCRDSMQAMRSFAFSTSTNSTQMLLCCGAGVCCFAPLMLHPSEKVEESLLKIALTSHQNRDSAMAALALTLPMILEIVTEMIFSFLRRNDTKKADNNIGQELLNWRERLILVCGIMTIPIAALLPSETTNIVAVYICLRKCRSMLVAGSIIISLCRYDPKMWSVRITYSILLLLAAGTIIGSFSTIVDSASRVGYGFFMSGVGVFFLCNTRRLCSICPILIKAINLSNTVKGISHIKETSGGIRDLMLQEVYLLSITVVSFILIVIYHKFPGFGLYSPTAMFYNNLAFVFYLLFITYISERKLKFAAMQGLVGRSLITFIYVSFANSSDSIFQSWTIQRYLIESKKMYARYISHELRTPLNSAVMGKSCIELI